MKSYRRGPMPWIVMMMLSTPAWTQDHGVDELEPGVDTYRPEADVPDGFEPADDTSSPVTGAANGLEPAVDTSRLSGADLGSPEPAVDTTAGTGAADDAGAPAPVARDVTRRESAAGVMDEMELGRTEITGNRELPKVLYIVPWQKSDPGDLLGRPVNTLIDEVLAPIDREEFLRQVGYYGDLYGDLYDDNGE